MREKYGRLAVVVVLVMQEAVAWASGLKDVLAGLLSLVMILAYVRSVEPTEGRQQRRWYVVAFVTYALAVLAKPSAIVSPLLAATIDRLILRRKTTMILRSLAPFLLLATNLPWSPFALLTLRRGFTRLWDEDARRLLMACHCWTWPNLVFWSIVPEHAARHSFPLFPGFAGLAAFVWVAWLTGRLPWPRWVRPGRVLVGLRVFGSLSRNRDRQRRGEHNCQHGRGRPPYSVH